MTWCQMISLLNTAVEIKQLFARWPSFFSMAQDTPTKQARQGYYSTIWYLIAAETATQFLFSLEALFHRPMKNNKNSEILSGRFYTLLIRPYSDAFSRLTFNERANGVKRGRGTWDSQVTFVFIPLKRALIVIGSLKNIAKRREQKTFFIKKTPLHQLVQYFTKYEFLRIFSLG